MSLIWIVVLVFVVISAITTAWGAWRAAPFLPTRTADVLRMMQLAEIKDGETVYDLGAGDGRMMLEAAKQGPNVRVKGFEISLPVFLIAKLRLALAKLGPRATISIRDFFHHPLSDADVVLCFLTPEAMKKLEPKFRQELKAGSRVISAVFPMPTWPLDTKDKPAGRVAVYRYRV